MGFQKIIKNQTLEEVFQLGDLRDLSAVAEKSYVLEEWTVLAPDRQRQLAALLSWESLSKWTFDVFEVNRLTNGQALLFMGWAILASPHAQQAMQTSVLPAVVSSPSLDDTDGYGFLENMDISPSILCNFIRSIEKDYNKENAYHNSVHAADVLQSMHSILTRIGDERIVITELESFSILLHLLSGTVHRRVEHFSLVRELQCLQLKHSQDSTEVSGTDLLPFLLHAADISGSARPRRTAVEWTDRVLSEFFAQGDKEKKLGLPVSPLCDRAETKRAQSQVGFIKFVVQPTFEVLGMFISKVEEEINPIIASNLEMWEDDIALEHTDWGVSIV